MGRGAGELGARGGRGGGPGDRAARLRQGPWLQMSWPPALGRGALLLGQRPSTLFVEFLHALPIAPPAPVEAAEIHSIPSKSTYCFNGIERESTLLTQLESNRRNSWCSNWTECEDVKHNCKARASQEQQGLRTFFNCGIGSAAAPKVLDI